jgi:hypothetical protein
MHVIHKREKIFYHLYRIGAALLELPDIRAEFDVPRVYRFEDGVRLVARFNASAGVLVQASGESDIGERFAVSLSGDVSSLCSLKL